MKKEIELTTPEMMMAAQAGIMRHVENIKLNKKPAYKEPQEQDWQIHIEGALCEFAIAKMLNKFWSGKGDRTKSDVGIYEVRGSQNHSHNLILHKEDQDDKIFWLITGKNGKYIVHGWLLAKDGKKEEYWKDPTGNRPAYFFPQSKLNSVSSYCSA